MRKVKEKHIFLLLFLIAVPSTIHSRLKDISKKDLSIGLATSIFVPWVAKAIRGGQGRKVGDSVTILADLSAHYVVALGNGVLAKVIKKNEKKANPWDGFFERSAGQYIGTSFYLWLTDCLGRTI